jgi:protein-L-isoaspartate(D-aspartate) O-methyltransferase
MVESRDLHARQQLVAALRRNGSIQSEAVASAMLAVSRDAFAPTGADAYDDNPILLKRNEEGAVVSTISQPTMVASMLEELAVEPGNAVLEIGTASGYNAALLAELAGETGRVVTIELEEDLAARAAGILNATGYSERVTVVVGDGSAGYAPAAPYDRIVVTAGAPSVAPAWVEELCEGGRLVVPITNRAGTGMSRTYVKIHTGLELVREIACGFVPLRH